MVLHVVDIWGLKHEVFHCSPIDKAKETTIVIFAAYLEVGDGLAVTVEGAGIFLVA